MELIESVITAISSLEISRLLTKEEVAIIAAVAIHAVHAFEVNYES